jgi:hypothetical protein
LKSKRLSFKWEISPISIFLQIINKIRFSTLKESLNFAWKEILLPWIWN